MKLYLMNVPNRKQKEYFKDSRYWENAEKNHLSVNLLRKMCVPIEYIALDL